MPQHGHTIPTRPMSPTVDISDSGLDGDRSNSQLDTSEESSSSIIPPISIDSDSDTMSDVLSTETLSTNASPVRAANTLLNGVTNCSGCGGAFDLLRYVCDTCGEKGCTAGSHFTHECVDGGLHSPDHSQLQSPTRSSSSTCVPEYMLCVDCFNSRGYDHTMSMSTCAASNSQTQLRHAFIEQFCMDGCWVDIGKLREIAAEFDASGLFFRARRGRSFEMLSLLRYDHREEVGLCGLRGLHPVSGLLPVSQAQYDQASTQYSMDGKGLSTKSTRSTPS